LFPKGSRGKAINSIEGIKTLSSSSREQVSGITAESDLEQDIDLAVDDALDPIPAVRHP
jgi:multidrug efflux pump